MKNLKEKSVSNFPNLMKIKTSLISKGPYQVRFTTDLPNFARVFHILRPKLYLAVDNLQLKKVLLLRTIS